MYIKGIHNTVADAISRLDYGPVTDDRSSWMTFAQCWCYHNSALEHNTSMANTKEKRTPSFRPEPEQYSAATITWQQPERTSWQGRLFTQLVENIQVLCKDGKMVIPKSLRLCIVAFFHHYLQDSGSHVSNEETLFYHFIEKVSEWESNHMSKSVIVSRWTSTVNRIIRNCHQSLHSPTLGRHYVCTP